MADSYRTLLVTLLPLVACPMPAEKDTGETGDADADTDTDADTDADTDTPGTASERGCYAVDPSAEACPAALDVPVGDVLPSTCGAVVLTVDGPGTVEVCPWLGGLVDGGWCTYPITVQLPRPEDACDYGRPLVLGGAPRLAPLARVRGWQAETRRGETDVARAETWARVGLAEHASIASFAKLSLELVALGAPADLVADAHAAAMDEVRHARLAFGLASTFAGTPVGPGPLPLADLSLAPDLVALAVATARDGCVAETLSALQVAEARPADDAERAVLAVLARDEARHAALAWRVVRWAIDAGGERVRVAVAEVFARVPAFVADGPLTSRAVSERGWNDVVRPTAAALLGASPSAVQTADSGHRTA